MREETYEMPVLTDGQRGAAIEDLRTEVKALQARIDCAELNDTYIPRVRERLLYAQIALASLTAQPVGEVIDVGGALLVEWETCLQDGSQLYTTPPATSARR